MKPKAESPVIIFVDGASSGNPGPGGWGAIIATPEGQVIELGGRENPTTNNRMELTGAIQALSFLANQNSPIEIFTDSAYVIRGITQWIWAWRKRDWVSAEGKDVANSDLWKRLFQVTLKKEIRWGYVRGHSGIPGNERADEIAVSFSQGKRGDLYRGPLLRYSIPIHDIPEDTSLPDLKPREKSGSKPQAYSYLSVVGTLAMRHPTWKECESRIKGQSGAKFKKAMSAEEESQILKKWGVDPKDVRG